MAFSLPYENRMNITCRHCDEGIEGKAYRVTSEEDGIVLLNMIVCASCAAAAKSLLLNTEEITPEEIMPAAPLSDVSDLLLAGFK
jgi:RNase P subunit RPR2